MGLLLAAARLLASLRIADAAQRLLRGMSDGDERDDAIEAMAALEPSDIPEAATDLAERLTRRWLVPPVTRVRAAYLLARVRPDEGGALLARMARSARASVRDAVVDARAALPGGDEAAATPRREVDLRNGLSRSATALRQHQPLDRVRGFLEGGHHGHLRDNHGLP
mgnify:CR=1 FL=1